MRIAVIGTGIAGLGAAWMLSRRHDVTVFERSGYIGGHSNTIDAAVPGGVIPVDTGFIVYNERTYPNLTRLFALLDVPTEPSDMSFSVSRDGGAFEFGGSLGGLAAQPANLLRPSYLSMLRDIVRFRGESHPQGQESVSELLARRGYGSGFRDDYLLPMAAAIWSAPLDSIGSYPAASFLRFFANHGLVRITDRPDWRTVTGGSREYVRRMAAPFRDRIRLNSPVQAVCRTVDGVRVRHPEGEEPFDQVVLASHSDQSLAILGADASDEERRVLSGLRYQPNRAVLHRDPGLMPRRRRVWSSWNYLAESAHNGRVSVTYWMNRLQNLDVATPLFVSLNPLRDPEPGTTIAEIPYEHPLFDHAALSSQAGLPAIQGVRNTWFCGAYAGWGFHEDGLEAGLRVAAALGSPPPWEGQISPVSPAAQSVPIGVPVA